MNTDLMFSSAGDYWRTETQLLEWLDRRGARFTLDAAASDDLIAPAYINAEMDALKWPWSGRVFCNPPYSMVEAFVKRALDQSRQCEGICMLVAARTETAWWQDSFSSWDRIELLRGRLKFWLKPEELELVNALRVGKGKKPLSSAENSAPFPSALLIKGFGYEKVNTFLSRPRVKCVDWRKEMKAGVVA
jgi:phage N-6-adenine-methyltransferase